MPLGPSTRGFTLVELAIVLVIVSLMTGFGMEAFQSTRDLDCNARTQQQLKDIDKALRRFVGANNRLPKPALLGTGSNDSAFGVEASTGYESIAVTGDNVITGMLPHATLGLRNDYAADCWGSKFIYAVTEKLTSSDSANGYPGSAEGKITLQSGALSSPTTVSDKGSYIVISTGQNRFGATPLSASNITARNCNGAAGTQIDKENCDIGSSGGNAIFAIAQANRGANATDYFDDLITFGEKASSAPTNLYCWGRNFLDSSNFGYDGSVGDGTTVTRTQPTRVDAGKVQFASLHLTNNVANPNNIAPIVNCAISTGGDAYCWGYNSDGSVGDGTTTPRTSPTLVSGGLKFLSIQMTADATLGNVLCGLTTTGQIYCWGRGQDYMLGVGTTGGTVTVSSPSLMNMPPFVGKTFVKVLIAARYGCALSNAGEMVCWGRNCEGQLSVGNFSCNSTPPYNTIASSDTFSDFAMSLNTICAIARSDSATNPRKTICWGGNAHGSGGGGLLGRNLDPSTTTRSFTLAPTTGGHEFVQLHGSLQSYFCGRVSDGTTYCWGKNGNSIMGNNTNADSWVPTEVNGRASGTPLSGTWKFKHLIESSWRTMCAINFSNELYCWGYASGFSLGDGTAVDKSYPVRIGTTTVSAATSTGLRVTCFLNMAGEQYCWGYNTTANPVIGDGSNSHRSAPAKSCLTGDATTCALRFSVTASTGSGGCAILKP